MLICIYLYVRQIKLTDPSARGRELNRNVPFGCHTCRVGLVDWGGGGCDMSPLACRMYCCNEIQGKQKRPVCYPAPVNLFAWQLTQHA